MNYQFRPIEAWPGTLRTFAQRKTAQFKSGYDDTLKLLRYECERLGAKNAVIQLAVRECDIRIDGMPKANSRPRHPGVIVSFESKHGPLSYPCDTYEKWQDNLRAIALGLEALRAVDRYGVTKRGEQYRGFRKLEAPEPFDPAEFISRGTGFTPAEVRQSEVVRREAYRRRAKKLHPDAGGSNDAMQRLNEAYQSLNQSEAA